MDVDAGHYWGKQNNVGSIGLLYDHHTVLCLRPKPKISVP